jgi:hypothetical protein
MDGDGHIDLVVGNAASGRVTVLRNRGDGTFVVGSSQSASVVETQRLALGDVDGDGSLDVVASTRTNAGASLVVMLNDGKGGLAPGINYVAGVAAGTIFQTVGFALGDVDGDGRLDVVSADATTKKLLLWRGAGHGVLAAPTPVDPGTIPANVVLADLDHDGALDLVLMCGIGGYCPGAGPIVLLRGDGHGAFAPWQALPSNAPMSMATGDLNGDGLLDVVTGNASWIDVDLSRCTSSASADAGGARD